jgi:ribosomal protein L7Ae-like RNA K-turn-binding protein
MLGFARRAGVLFVGSQATTGALQKGKAQLLLLSLDASPRTVKKIQELAGDKIPIVRYGQKEELGKDLGYSGQIAVLAVTQEHFARSILRLTCKEKDWGEFIDADDS